MLRHTQHIALQHYIRTSPYYSNSSCCYIATCVQSAYIAHFMSTKIQQQMPALHCTATCFIAYVCLLTLYTSDSRPRSSSGIPWEWAIDQSISNKCLPWACLLESLITTDTPDGPLHPWASRVCFESSCCNKRKVKETGWLRPTSQWGPVTCCNDVQRPTSAWTAETNLARSEY